MGNLFSMDSPLMKVLSRVADLLILNLLTVVCCIPVITAGAAFSAMYYVLLKMVRGEEGYIVKQYFKAFKEN
ncbi:MAG: YesL family protein, partial [Lachnospiraceae bacterium]|nr:YesL family protein [Lachnospiraceae bacterium]